MGRSRRGVLADYLSRTRSLWEPAAAAGSTGSASRLRAAVQFVHLFCQGFSDKRGSARAAALSYSTLLALVPLLAVAPERFDDFGPGHLRED